MRLNVAVRLTSSPAVRQGVLLGYDALATLCGLYWAMLLRFGGEVPPHFETLTARAVPILVLVRLACVTVGGLHRWSFRMAGITEAARHRLPLP
jgi:hypothetical protein